MYLPSITLNLPQTYPLDDADNIVLSLCAKHGERVEGIKYLRIKYNLNLKIGKDLADQYFSVYNANIASETWRNEQVRKAFTDKQP